MADAVMASAAATPPAASASHQHDTLLPYVATRRRMPPGHALFEEGDLDRALHELAQPPASREEVPASPRVQREFSGLHVARHECSNCGAVLPTAFLLDVHLSEQHDSFFAAQVARRLKVFVCLVEGCGELFATTEDRKHHLHDAHRFPADFEFDHMHLRKHKAQPRPLPQLQKATPKPHGSGRSATREPVSPVGVQAAPASSAAAGAHVAVPGPHGARMASNASDYHNAAAAGLAVVSSTAAPQVEQLAAGLARLSTGQPASATPAGQAAPASNTAAEEAAAARDPQPSSPPPRAGRGQQGSVRGGGGGPAMFSFGRRAPGLRGGPRGRGRGRAPQAQQ